MWSGRPRQTLALVTDLNLVVVQTGVDRRAPAVLEPLGVGAVAAIALMRDPLLL
jgi:hypothetical protein